MYQYTSHFSVVIPTYNRAEFIKETILSVLAQSFNQFEVIVIDDGSIDETPAVLREFGDQIRTITTVNRGAENARNIGIKAAQGEYIVFLDSDDILYPNTLSIYNTVICETGAHLLLSKGEGFSGTPPTRYSDGPIVYDLSKDYLSKKSSVWLSTSFVVVKKDALLAKNIFFKEQTFPVDDLDFVLRAGTIPICCIMKKPITVGYRLHPNNSIKNIAINLEKLELILDYNKVKEYPGGKQRALGRQAIIGGHIQNWVRIGFKNKLPYPSLQLLWKGKIAILALVTNKIVAFLMRSKPVHSSEAIV